MKRVFLLFVILLVVYSCTNKDKDYTNKYYNEFKNTYIEITLLPAQYVHILDIYVDTYVNAVNDASNTFLIKDSVEIFNLTKKKLKPQLNSVTIKLKEIENKIQALKNPPKKFKEGYRDLIHIFQHVKRMDSIVKNPSNTMAPESHKIAQEMIKISDSITKFITENEPL
ncbi:hypothetical protein [Apibacter mensalis]|nr:hypothetical protein [Apibacter mensalis]